MVILMAVRGKEIIFKKQELNEKGNWSKFTNAYIKLLTAKEANIPEKEKRTYYRQREKFIKDMEVPGGIIFDTLNQIYYFLLGYQMDKPDFFGRHTGKDLTCIKLDIELQWEKEEKRREYYKMAEELTVELENEE